jgi:hypothetical protein
MCRCRRRAWSIKGLTSCGRDRLTAHPRRIDQHGDVPLEVVHRQDPALRVARAQLVEFLLAVIGDDSMGRLAESFLVTGVGTIPRHETGTRRIRGRLA